MAVQNRPTPDAANAPNASDSTPAPLSTAKFAAIHRSILSGLLSNVGSKRGPQDYEGVQARSFAIFPGSGVAKRRPPWIMAAELVETRRLYARTVAAIEPHWIEQLASHLVKRTHSDPHWRMQSGQVIAWERVALGSLVLVAKRGVPFGPIDPIQSRQLFIHHALVECEMKCSADFFRHNQALLADAYLLEAKARRRDLLADPAIRYAFFDGRIPEDVFDVARLERWRRSAERPQPELLFLSPEQVLSPNAAEVTREAYPDALDVGGGVGGGLPVALEYRFDPGVGDDGITAAIPLSAIHNVDLDRLTWLVPGWRVWAIEAMIRNLPKSLRTQFVPVPDVARAASAILEPGDGTLAQALAIYLTGRGASRIEPSLLQPLSLPEYLRLNLRIIDDAGRTLAMGRDLDLLRADLGERTRRALAELPPSAYQRRHVRQWDFGDLPPRIQVKRHGMTLQAYPALIDRGESVDVAVLDDPLRASTAHEAGVRRLYLLRQAGELAYLTKTLPHLQAICLAYAPLGACDSLKSDIATAVVQQVLLDGQPPVRTQAEFEQRVQEAWPRMASLSKQVAQTVEQILELYHALSLALAQDYPPLLLAAVSDLRQQLALLVPPDFVATTPTQWFAHLPRYLRAMQLRLTKLTRAGLERDSAAMAQLAGPWEAYLAKSRHHAQKGTIDPALVQYRWMLEEWRVSLFAQELKTPTPISAQRLAAQWEKTRP